MKTTKPFNRTTIAHAPGRINLIGEHTDYNEGFVLPAAIDKKTVFQLNKNGTANTINIFAEDLNERFSFNLDTFQPIKSGWQNYIMGVVHELLKEGAKISGFDGRFKGNVPIGSGMSSSASLECSLAIGLNELFEAGLDKWQLIKAAQMAEHNFVKIKCGIMDQFASVMGKKNQVMLLDCRSLEFKYFPFDLGDYQLLLLNSNVSHTLASSAYNTRRAACEEGVSIICKKNPGVKSLRDVSYPMLQALKSELPETIFKRCHHVITENQRVLDASEALLNKDFKQLGNLVYQSHFSLQKDYEVSCPELDFLVQQTLEKDYIPGSRMMGGGFGGCTINIIEKKRVDTFIEQVSKQYYDHFKMDLSPYDIKIEEGASVSQAY